MSGLLLAITISVTNWLYACTCCTTVWSECNLFQLSRITLSSFGNLYWSGGGVWKLHIGSCWNELINDLFFFLLHRSHTSSMTLNAKNNKLQAIKKDMIAFFLLMPLMKNHSISFWLTTELCIHVHGDWPPYNSCRYYCQLRCAAVRSSGNIARQIN